MVCGGTIMTQYGKYKYIKLYQNNLIYSIWGNPNQSIFLSIVTSFAIFLIILFSLS